MNLTEDQIIEKYGKRCGHCNRNMLLCMNMNAVVLVVGITL